MFISTPLRKLEKNNSGKAGNFPSNPHKKSENGWSEGGVYTKTRQLTNEFWFRIRGKSKIKEDNLES